MSVFLKFEISFGKKNNEKMHAQKICEVSCFYEEVHDFIPYFFYYKNLVLIYLFFFILFNRPYFLNLFLLVMTSLVYAQKIM